MWESSACLKNSNISLYLSLGIPIPVSLIEMVRMFLSINFISKLINPFCVNLTAFLIKLDMICVIFGWSTFIFFIDISRLLLIFIVFYRSF